MAIITCPACGAKNRVDEQRAGRAQPVCGRCGAKLPASAAGGGEPIVVSDATFGAVALQSDGRPVLVDCWAPWCGPCRLIGPIVDQLAAESGGRYIVAKLNVDQNPRTAAQFGISSIPTLLLFKNGGLVEQLVGAQPKQVIAGRLRALVGA